MAVLLAAIVFFAQIVGGKGLPAKGYVLSRARGVERGILLKEGGAGRIFRGGRAIMVVKILIHSLPLGIGFKGRGGGRKLEGETSKN
eukprot:1358660-Amorphochlora_amoeboformis.AAC.2